MKNNIVFLSKLKNKKFYIELWCLIILITLGFYFCPSVIIKIIKILVITIIPIIMWLLIYFCQKSKIYKF